MRERKKRTHQEKARGTPRCATGFLLGSVVASSGYRRYQLVGPVSTFDSIVACTVLLTAERMS